MGKSNWTKEELEYYNSLSKKEKISYSLKHRSEEDKREAEAKRLVSRNQWSEDKKQEIIDRTRNTRANRTQEQKEAQLVKFRNTLNSRTEEEKQLNRNKHIGRKYMIHPITKDRKNPLPADF